MLPQTCICAIEVPVSVAEAVTRTDVLWFELLAGAEIVTPPVGAFTTNVMFA
jgi:hypothetical protein